MTFLSAPSLFFLRTGSMPCSCTNHKLQCFRIFRISRQLPYLNQIFLSVKVLRHARQGSPFPFLRASIRLPLPFLLSAVLSGAQQAPLFWTASYLQPDTSTACSKYFQRKFSQNTACLSCHHT